MFRKYGFVGIILILFAQLNFLLEIQPFALYYIPIIWLGYIFVVDALVYKIQGKSLIYNEFKKFILIVFLSIPIWAVFELYNVYTKNWTYINYTPVVHFINFTIILPAVLETYMLLKATNIFDKFKLKKEHKITNSLLFWFMIMGVVFLIIPILIPKYTFPLVWFGFFFLLDPINYLHKSPSIISHLKDRNLTIPLALFFGAIICGFFWEFWNFWAYPKWFYEIPFFGFFKLFEMPILGYLGYGPFGWELYAMYNFVVGLFSKKKSILSVK